MAGVTTEMIQQYLDENTQLILAILEYNNTGKLAESLKFQARLQDNLTYLAAVADTQAHMQTFSQNPPNVVMQLAPSSMSYQQPQQLITRLLMADPSSMFWQQQQQQASTQSQLVMSSGANIGFNILPGGGGQLRSLGGGQYEEGNVHFSI